MHVIALHLLNHFDAFHLKALHGAARRSVIEARWRCAERLVYTLREGLLPDEGATDFWAIYNAYLRDAVLALPPDLPQKVAERELSLLMHARRRARGIEELRQRFPGHAVLG